MNLEFQFATTHWSFLWALSYILRHAMLPFLPCETLDIIGRSSSGCEEWCGTFRSCQVCPGSISIPFFAQPEASFLSPTLICANPYRKNLPPVPRGQFSGPASLPCMGETRSVVFECCLPSREPTASDPQASTTSLLEARTILHPTFVRHSTNAPHIRSYLIRRSGEKPTLSLQHAVSERSRVRSVIQKALTYHLCQASTSKSLPICYRGYCCSVGGAVSHPMLSALPSPSSGVKGLITPRHRRNFQEENYKQLVECSWQTHTMFSCLRECDRCREVA